MEAEYHCEEPRVFIAWLDRQVSNVRFNEMLIHVG